MNRRFLASSDGAVAVSTAVLLTLLVGLSGLGVEASLWYQTKRSMQGAADAAAVSAAYALTGSGSCTGGSACTWASGLHGLGVAAENGWQYGATNGTQVRVVSPPTRSGWTSNPNAVEVWITQQQPILFGAVANIAAPTIGAYAIATVSRTSGGDGCVLALANAKDAVQVTGNGVLAANCGLFIDGGIDQNVSGTPQGDITFSGNAKIQVSSLTVAGSSSLTTGTVGCPNTSRCFMFTPSSTPLPAAKVKTSTGTADPYVSRIFTRPVGATAATVVATGSGYTNGTRTFKVNGGTGIPAKFTAKVTGGKVGTPITIIDPGAYTVAPTNPVSVTDTGGGGSGATFTLTTVAGACLAWDAAPIAGRAYCSINVTSDLTFPSGIYYIEGGSSCPGFCIGGNTTALSASGGVTFVLTNGTGSASTSYATITMAGNSVLGSNTQPFAAPAAAINADGSACVGSCANTTQGLVFFQDRNATASTGDATPGSTDNSFSGNSVATLYGVVYLPRQTFSQQGNAQISGGPKNCVGLVAKYIDAAGNPSFSNGCLPGTGITPIGGTTTTKSTLSE